MIFFSMRLTQKEEPIKGPPRFLAQPPEPENGAAIGQKITLLAS